MTAGRGRVDRPSTERSCCRHACRPARIAALGLEALTVEGQPFAPDWRRFRLEVADGALGVPEPDGMDYPLHLTAGPINALANST